MATIRVKADYPTIQAAVDAALPGDVILVEDGVYSEQVTVSKNSIHFIGANKTVLDGGMTLDTGFILNGTTGVTVESFIVKNFRNDGIDILENGQANVFENLKFYDINYSGISLFAGAVNNRITGCSITGAFYGVYDNSQSLVVEDCAISYCGGDAVTCNSANTIVRNCSICKNTGSGILVWGRGALITGNRLDGNMFQGIFVQTGIVIEGNEVINSGDTGIFLFFDNNLVRGNRVCSNGGHGIDSGGIGYNSIIDNESSNNARAGILVYSQWNVIQDNKACHNGTFDLIRCYANNTVKNNQCGASIPRWLCGCGQNETEPPCSKAGSQECPQQALRVPGDFKTIQAAVDAALPGDVIWVESGIYHEQVTVGTSLIKIIGAGKTVLDGEMKLDTAFILNDTTGVEIMRFCVKNYRNDGIDILGGSGNQIINTVLLNTNYNGVYMDAGSVGSRILECRVEGAFYGVYDVGGSQEIDASRMNYNGYIGICAGSNTRIRGCMVGHNYDTGIYCLQNGTRIFDCEVYDNLSGGITTQENSLIEDCEINGNRSGIELRMGGNIVKQSRIRSNAGRGITMGNYSNNAVIGNRVKCNGYIGISVATGSLAQGNTAYRNKPYDIQARQGSFVRNNRCGAGFPPIVCGGCGCGTEDLEPSTGDFCGAIWVPQDYPTIQAAVDAANPGDTILVDNGVYCEQILVEKSFIKIIGRGRAILDGGMKMDTGLRIISAEGVEVQCLTIRNYNINGMVVAGGSRAVSVVGAQFINNMYGLWLDTSAADIRISNCRAACNYYGVDNQSANFVAENCRFVYNNSRGISSYGDNATISRCVCSNNLNYGIVVGINASVTGNRVYGNLGTGVTASRNCVIRKNEIYKNYLGIEIDSGRSQIEENRICENNAGGIYVTFYSTAAVLSNHVCGNTGYGIKLGSQTNIVEGNTAGQNENYDIVRLYANNTIRNNICDKSFPPGLCAGCPKGSRNVKAQMPVAEEE